MSEILLRDYQADAINATEAAFQSHQSAMMVLATGLGKTVCFTDIAARHDGRTLVICPFIPLIDQAANKIRERTGHVPDIEQADQRAQRGGWGENKYVVASQQTLVKGRYASLGTFGLVVIDEAHLFHTAGGREVIGHFREQGAKILLVTATPKRHDKKAMGQLADVVSYQKEIDTAVDEGWLVAPKASTIVLKTLDLSQVPVASTTHGRDLAEKQLNEALENYETIAEIAEVTAREYHNEKTVVYCSSVNEAKLVAERLADIHHVKAGWIAADERRCPRIRRAELMHSFTKDPHGLMVLCNVGILTTGWDFPGLMHIVMARPTKSLPLYQQIIGRATRALPGVVDFEGSTPETRRERIAASAKPHFRVTDLVDATHEHKLISAVDVLGGRYDDSVRLAVAKQLENGERGRIDELLAAEQARQREKAEEKDRRKRARIAARVEYEAREVDMFGGPRVPASNGVNRKIVMPWGKHKGTPVVETPKSYLRWFAETMKDLKPYLRNAIDATLNGSAVPRTAPPPHKQPEQHANTDEVNQLFLEAMYQ